jgi:hypothetical protein
MSVALQIPAWGGSPPNFIPIATEAVFASEWLPVALSFGATWLPRFQVGTAVEYEDLGPVASEFAKAAEHFIADRKEHLAVRATAVVMALRDVASSSHPGLVLYIG